MTYAVIFPGQGSQAVGMSTALAESNSEVKDIYAQASEVLAMDCWRLMAEGPKEDLDKTTNTQPLMLIAGYSVWTLLEKHIKNQQLPLPAFMAGHSLGEYTALVSSGALEFTQALTLVRERAQLMQQAVPEGKGAMAAILGLDDDGVRQVCEQAAEGDVVEAVNFNSPGQVVIAGSKTAVERATVLAKEQGAKRALLLPVSVPSHCALMSEAAQGLAQVLAKVSVQECRVPVINNTDVAIATGAGIKEALSRQLHRPVRWVETIQKIKQEGINNVYELGPGKILTGLNKRIDKSMTCTAVFDGDSLSKMVEELK